jgi:hypothetical protein
MGAPHQYPPAAFGATALAILVAVPTIYFGTAGWVLGLQARHVRTAGRPIPPKASGLLIRFYEPALFLSDHWSAYDRWILWQWDHVDR